MRKILYYDESITVTLFEPCLYTNISPLESNVIPFNPSPILSVMEETEFANTVLSKSKKVLDSTSVVTYIRIKIKEVLFLIIIQD